MNNGFLTIWADAFPFYKKVFYNLLKATQV